MKIITIYDLLKAATSDEKYHAVVHLQINKHALDRIQDNMRNFPTVSLTNNFLFNRMIECDIITEDNFVAFDCDDALNSWMMSTATFLDNPMCSAVAFTEINN